MKLSSLRRTEVLIVFAVSLLTGILSVLVGMYSAPNIYILLAFITTLCIPYLCKLIGVRRQVRIATWFFVIAQIVGIYPRAFITSNGWDSFIGPWESEWIPQAAGVLMLYNVFFLGGIMLGHILTLPKEKSRFFKRGTRERIPKFVGSKTMLTSLLICSIPGVILILGHHHTILNDQNIAVDRTGTQGMGPQILLQDIPYAALTVWYSFTRGRVRIKWWLCAIFLVGLSFMSGSRSQALDSILVLIALHMIQSRKKMSKRTMVSLIILGFILMYVGWTIVYARGMMMTIGGSFFYWALQGAQMNPVQAYSHLAHASFNGWDGLVSVVGTVPVTWPYHNGQLLYQCLTILIPRSVWISKWTMDLVNQFTHYVWGWGSGGNFVTGAGAMFLDSGWTGVMFGSLFLGTFTSLLCRANVDPDTNHWFAKIVVSVWCFFLAGFTYAGGAMDADITGAMILEVWVILIVITIVRNMFVVRPTATTINRAIMNRKHGIFH